LRALAAIGIVALAVAGVATAAGEVPAEAVLAELPFLEAGPNQVRVDLAAEGGRQLPLLLDTGALQSFATAGGARDLGIPLRRNKQTPYRRETRLGRDIELHVDTRRGDTGVARGGDYALAGAAFLSRYVLEIDFPGRRVRFLDPDRFEVPASDPAAAVLPMRPGTTQPIVEIEVGGVRLPAILATGAPGTLIVPGGWAAEPDAQVAIDAEETAKLELPPGTAPMQAARAARVRLAGFEERDVPLLVAPQGVWGQGARSEALLGVDFLKRFVVRIDYPRRRLWIRDGGAPAGEPPPVSAPPPPPRPRGPKVARGVG
jgi:predicted aspartyl protease